MTVILAAIISTSLLTKLAIFGAATAGVWFLLDLLSPGRPRAEMRLEEFREPNLRRGDRKSGSMGVTKRSDGMARLLERASPKLSKSLQPKTAEEAGKLKSKLSYAGFRGEAVTSIFLG